MPHNLALVDDHPLMRAGLISSVNGLGDYRVTVDAGDGRELIDRLKDVAPGSAEAPTIAIVDLNMPVMDGYATMVWLREHRPEMLPLVLTVDATDEAMVRAVHAGARGFLLKSASPAVLKTALDSLVLTGYYATDGTLSAQRMAAKEEHGRDGIIGHIGPREMEFLLLVCDEAEFTYEQIADRMHVHRRTVDGYRVSLFEKFNIKSKTGLVLFALRWGLLKTI